jgi:hypothetical protein
MAAWVNSDASNGAARPSLCSVMARAELPGRRMPVLTGYQHRAGERVGDFAVPVGEHLLDSPHSASAPVG